jgi:hypothetical protein
MPARIAGTGGIPSKCIRLVHPPPIVPTARRSSALHFDGRDSRGCAADSENSETKELSFAACNGR